MRTSIMLASALAATALAKPFEKRAEVVVTTVDVVYTTAIVTVTAGQQNAAATVKPTGANAHRKHRPSKQHSYKPLPTYQPPQSSAPATSAPAPVPSSSKAPAPVPSSSEAPAPIPSTYAPPPQSSSAPAPQPTSSGGLITNYKDATVQHHNFHRANHSAPDIAWDQGLADIAMKIAKTCVYQHSMNVDGVSYGQNIAAGQSAGQISETISDSFYNGEVAKFTQYGAANPDMGSFHGWGHFSQIVWKDTTKVGCATFDCGANLQNFDYPNGFFTVCNYSPPGNFGGEYGSNIGQPQNKPTVEGSYNVNATGINESYCKATNQEVRKSGR